MDKEFGIEIYSWALALNMKYEVTSAYFWNPVPLKSSFNPAVYTFTTNDQWWDSTPLALEYHAEEDCDGVQRYLGCECQSLGPR